MVSRTRIHIDLDRALGQRDPLFYGYFLEHFHRQVSYWLETPSEKISVVNASSESPSHGYTQPSNPSPIQTG
jgi:hypothetical protein